MQNKSIVVRPMIISDDISVVSALIYNTDPYIYPEAFGDINNAKAIIPDLINKRNGLFSPDNILVATVGKDVQGIAVLLKESVSSIPLTYFNNRLPELFFSVRDLYFNKLDGYLDSICPLYLACLCVKQEHRNSGIGSSVIDYKWLDQMYVD